MKRFDSKNEGPGAKPPDPCLSARFLETDNTNILNAA